jgi:hypothetical protein
MDTFAGGLIVQSMIAFWFHVRFGIEAGVIGSIFFGANILAGISALLAGRLARKIGLINTMVFTHIPSNILLMLVPLMPSLSLAVGVLLLRFSISQMDVPTRQSYTGGSGAGRALCRPGVTTIARRGCAISSLTGIFYPFPRCSRAVSYPGLKIIYTCCCTSFRRMKPPEEQTGPAIRVDSSSDMISLRAGNRSQRPML